jgi:2-polyprenyl-3-methyl-5-hydroxy-6-metoxy-1,4-benzoquinol methylase
MKSKWDERYGESEYFYGTEPNSFLAAHAANFQPGAKVLCLAEGEGRNAVYLAKLGCKVTAIDSSKVGLQKLHSLAALRGVKVETICCDIADYSFENQQWDAMISIWCHLPSELRARVHQAVVKSLKPNGFFLLESYTPEQLKFKTGGPQDSDLMPTLGQLEIELNGLNATLKQELQRDVSEGFGHRGRSAVVQYIGFRI